MREAEEDGRSSIWPFLQPEVLMLRVIRLLGGEPQQIWLTFVNMQICHFEGRHLGTERMVISDSKMRVKGEKEKRRGMGPMEVPALECLVWGEEPWPAGAAGGPPPPLPDPS